MEQCLIRSAFGVVKAPDTLRQKVRNMAEGDKSATKWNIKVTTLRMVSFAVVVIMLVMAFTPKVQEEKFVTAPGILRVYAYELTEKNMALTESIELKEGVWMPYEYGWHITTNTHPGLALRFCVDKRMYPDIEVTLEMHVQDGEFFKDEGAHYFGPGYLGKHFEIKNDHVIYWHSWETDVKNWPEIYDEKAVTDSIRDSLSGKENAYQLPKVTRYFEDDETYVEIIVRANEHIVGCMLVRIYADENRRYFAEMNNSICYPKVNGEYQQITEEYIREQFAKWQMKE